MNSSLRTKTDHELIQNFQDGDLNALETLVLRHKDKMYTSILFLVKDKYLAEDIFQDVLIKIIDTIRGGLTQKKASSFPGQCVSLTTFVLTISGKLNAHHLS